MENILMTTIIIPKLSKKEKPFVVLSESSLGKEWFSKEDDVWDKWAASKQVIFKTPY